MVICLIRVHVGYFLGMRYSIASFVPDVFTHINAVRYQLVTTLFSTMVVKVSYGGVDPFCALLAIRYDDTYGLEETQKRVKRVV